MREYKRAEVSGEEVGEQVVRQAQYFAKYNLLLVASERGLSLVAKEIEERRDENGKPISSTKAKVYTDATKEAGNYALAKAHVLNIEQYINALKALQKGVLQEYAHMGT